MSSIARRSSPFTKTASTSCQRCASLACAKSRTIYSKPRGVQARSSWPTGPMRPIMLPISLQRGFRCVLLGEAEWTLLELVQQLLQNGNSDVSHIPGLAYLHPQTGEQMRTPSRPLMRDVNVMPEPARDLIDIQQYEAAWKSAHGFFSLNLVSSRGCPYRCNWCAKPIYGDHFSVRSPESVAEEMRRLKYEHAAEHLWFADDIFGLKPKWVCEFASEVELRRAAVPFKMQSRVDLMSAETVHALHRAGCVEVWMGVESGSQKILNGHGQGNPRRSGRSGTRKSSQRRNSRVLFSAVWLSRRELARHSDRPSPWFATRARTILASRSLTPCPELGSSIASAPNWARKPTGLTVKTSP